MVQSISRVEINNFRQFKKLNITLNQSKDKNLNVLIGDNRFGKTNILNALLWCLYGKEEILHEGTDSTLHFLKNERYPDTETEVCIYLEGSDSSKKIIKRNDKKLSVNRKDASKSEFIPSKDPEMEVRTLLPPSIKNLFLFKGEFLDNLFDYKERNSLRETIMEVSKLNQLVKLINILDMLENKYRNKIQNEHKNNKDLEDISRRIENYSSSIKKLTVDLENTRKDIDKRNKELTEVNKLFSGFDERNIKELTEQENSLNEDKISIGNEIRDVRKEIFNLFFNNISKWFVYSAMRHLSNKTKELEKEGMIPPPATPALINKIVTDQKCICGCKVTKSMESELKKHLKVLNTQKTKFEELYKMSLGLDIDKNRFNELKKSLQDLLKKKEEKEKKLVEINKRITNVLEKLKSLNKSNLNEMLAKKDSLEVELSELRHNEADYISDIKNFQDEKNILDVTYNRISSKLAGTKLISQKREYCRDLKEKIKLLLESGISSLSEELKKNTVNYFKEIFWDNYKYINYEIKINKEFEIEVISPKGNNMLPFLSTGEKKVLGLSFMAALSDFYGFDFPIVIDAPFTALQKEVILKMLVTLIKLSKRKQITIFTIPHEKDIMEELSTSSCTIYKLNKDKEDNTIIEEIK